MIVRLDFNILVSLFYVLLYSIYYLFYMFCVILKKKENAVSKMLL